MENVVQDPNSNRVRMRRASHSDAGVITEIRDSCWRAFYKDFLGESPVEDILKFRKEHPTKRDFEETLYLILELDGEPIAYASAGSLPDDPKGAFVKGIYVKPEHIGKGYGTLLLNALKDKFGKLKLKVLKDNKRAIRFYEDNGFKAVGEEKARIGGHLLDSLVMEWTNR